MSIQNPFSVMVDNHDNKFYTSGASCAVLMPFTMFFFRSRVLNSLLCIMLLLFAIVDTNAENRSLFDGLMNDLQI